MEKRTYNIKIYTSSRHSRRSNHARRCFKILLYKEDSTTTLYFLWKSMIKGRNSTMQRRKTTWNILQQGDPHQSHWISEWLKQRSMQSDIKMHKHKTLQHEEHYNMDDCSTTTPRKSGIFKTVKDYYKDQEEHSRRWYNLGIWTITIS